MPKTISTGLRLVLAVSTLGVAGLVAAGPAAAQAVPAHGYPQLTEAEPVLAAGATPGDIAVAGLALLVAGGIVWITVRRDEKAPNRRGRPEHPARRAGRVPRRPRGSRSR